MLAIKECLIREGVLNLTSTSNLGNGALGDEENRVGGVGAAVAGAAATANSNNIYGNRFSDAAAVSNNLRAISANYTYNNDNRYKRYNDKMTATTAATTNTTTLALEPQLAKLRDQKSVDTTHSPNTNYENKSSNCSLSSASVTAKSSCQQTSSVYDKIKHQQQQQQQLQQQQQRQQTSKHHSKEQQQQPGTRSSSSSSTRYHGVHPHFHHHTAPAYYTDVNLHIHTPKANDVTSLNENYQSVYNTPTQLVKEHYFPKTSTATVVPPPIGTGAAVIGRASTTSPSSLEKRERERERNKVPIDSASSNNKSANTAAARAAFFRGGSAGSSGYNNGERPSHEALAKSSPAFGRPTETGELNDTTYTPYVDSGSSFVVVDINSSSDCSKYNNNNNVKPLDDNSATDITQHDSINHNYNNSNIKSITSPTSPTGTNTSTTTTSAGRSRNSHRFAGKRRAVRVRSESRPISALYDIICKEKGLDIGTSTTNEEDSSAPSNDDDAHHSARNSHNTKGKSKERSHPRSSSSRNNSLKNSKDYAEISNCLTAFVANSLSNYLGGTAYDQSNMDHAATASGDTNATHDRAKRSHKARASSGHKPGSKKRKDVGGKTKASTPRSPRDEELNGETSEDSNDAFAHTPLSARSKHRADCNRRMNGTEKAASLPPQLHVTAQHATTTTGTGMPQKATTHTNNVESNTHLNVRKKCSIHCRCQLGCECRSANSAHRTTHYPYEYHQSSLPPNLSSGTCSSVRSPSTADDESLGYSPEKLYIEPVNMNLSGISSSPANAKHANSSSSGVVLEPTSSIHSVRNTKERVSRAQQRRLREEMRRHTDLPQLDSLSPSSLSNISQVVGAAEKALSEDEGVAGVKQQDNRTSRARRFINRPSRTPSRGRSANSAHSSPHSARRINTQHADNSTSSSSPPAESTHSRHLTAAAAGDDYSLSNLALPPVSPNASTVTIEDVGSTSSSDHIAHIQLSPLQIMTNSATPATELRPPANGSAALDVGEAHPADTEVNAEAGTANFGVQVAISAEALRQRKYEVHTHKSPHKNPSKTNTRTITTTSTTPTITSVGVTNRSSATIVNQRDQQQQQPLQYNNESNYISTNANHNSASTACTHNSNSCHNSYAMPTETFLLKQKAAMLGAGSTNTNNSNTGATVVVKKKPLSPLQIIALPHNATLATLSHPNGTAAEATTLTATTAHQLSHQHNAQQHHTDVGVHRQQQQLQTAHMTQTLPRRPSPLLGAPLSPFAAARSPLSPCASPHYVRPTKASRLRAAALDKKKCEDETIQRPRSPCYGSPLTSPRPAASPKHQSPRLSTSSSSDNPRPTTADSESDTKLAQNSSLTVKQRLTSTSSNESPTTNKKLIPSVSVSVKQNLSELQFNGGPKKTSSSKLKKPRTTATPAPATECTAKFTRSAGRLSTAEESDTHVLANKATKPLPRPRTSATIKSSKSKSTNDLKPASSDSSPGKPELSPVNGVTPASPLEDRDKSSKRKSNLNRSLNEEATVDSVINLKYLLLTAKIRKNKLFLNDSLAARRRRRRELGMVRQLVPPDDPVLREMLSPRQNKTDTSAKNLASHKPPHNELAYHMEIARRGWDLVNPSVSNRARSETASPKYELHARESLIRERPSSNRLARRSDTLHLGELRKLRSNDVNRKVNERTKTDLAEIKKIAEQANVEMAMMASGIAADLAAQAVRGGEDYISNDLDGRDSNECIVELATPARYGIGSRQQALTPPPAPSYTELEVAAEAKERDPSPAKHATFVQEERIYYEPEADELVAKSISNTTMSGGILRQRILKARSMERDAGHEPPKLSPILRRRSTDDPTYIPVPTGAAGVYSTSPSTSTHNHIVSILKKKDHIAGESSSASSNASPVTFSANVVDTPTSKQKRAGILKKRSSLDESRYYSRSHSPDERSILIKSARRNSLEETAGLQQQQQHGILKQSSYESSKSDGCPSATEPHPHGILKKKDSTSTPSDGGTHAPKHVSISQAVKMAAAELGRETADNQAIAGGEHDESGYTPSNEEYEIRPILKLESISSDDAMRPPKPILKKKSSGDSDEYEIRPILKTSRKSSREEFDLGGAISEDGRHYSEPPPPIVRPILKTDSPSKRRSLGGEELEPDVFSAEQVSGQSPSLLKRRTRSLERQEVPVVDLAAALNAIATSQAAPLEFVSTPITTGGSISVAERIKNMEMFLSSNGTSPSTPVDANTSWESPLQSGVTPKLFKPSAIRRDMYRDRYKTQPITNDEKLHFKATASPLDTSTTSAFKPTKSLDAGLNYNTFAHLNAPTAASSVSPGSSYTLTRCATQPLHSQHHFKAAETSSSSGTPPPPLPTLRATIGRHNSLSDSYSNANNNNHNNSISEQLNLSAGSDSERIFEMSGIEEAPIESAGKVEGGADAAGAGAGLTRKNSVRARANMFQQLQQEKTRSAEATSALAGTALGREERTSPRRGSSQLSPTTSMLPTIAPIMSSSISSTSGLHTNSHEEPKTPQNPIRTDEEIEPTSLPVSERLRFFTNLTEAASRSASSSYTRSPSQRFLTATDRCGSANSFSHNNSFTFTSRSSYNGDSTSTSSASASVTPTPMECCSPPLTEQQQLISINEIDSPLQLDSARHSPSPPPSIGLPNVTQQASSTYIHLTKSSSQTLLPSVLAQRLAMSAPAPTATAAALTTSPSSLTPVARRIKMKTIGKLLLPNTFLNNERNSLQNFSSNTSENGVSVNSAQSDTCESESGSYIEADNKAPPAPLKKIGKIKSPFIENCLQMQQKHHQLNSKCMKYDHKSTPHNALAALENNGSNGNGGGGGGERDINSLPPRKPLQNGNAGLPPPPRIETTEDSKADSGKENNYCDTNAAPLLTLSPTASSIALSEQLSQSPVVEMRKKFTRIMSSATLSTVAQRHTAHALSNGNGNNNGNAQANGNSASSAPTTPRNSIIDDKFAKYFGLTTGGNQPAAATATTNKATNGNQRTARAQESLNTATARSVGASETSLSSRSATNYPPLPPPDFAGTPNGDLHASVKKLTDALSFAKEINTSSATPHEAFNHNVRSNSNTPYFTPPSVCAYDITLTQTSSATGTASAGGSASTGVSASAVQRRRDMSKRQRANTTNITFTPTSSNTQLFSAQANADTPSSGRTRALRSRALTLTHGVPLPEVKRFEDIVVTKEEFQLASKEFERIFLGVI
ncbi:serine/arginine repetitive matrix protein 2-like isoform X2 [Bactrocera tryoni]|uniref:serine/arginine repetitive matrix protein 2-like isoform X2 n=1 Tax=Bactrocera tryoni TaxID=59916 RepID=UPI001A98C71A|nr:serine/arginine repetitive matrix protein 2-like isoform X2 [Bactrocera tryoni]